VQGKDRLYVKYVAEQLGLDGSYVPRTYIEQIQLEKLVNDVMVWLFLLSMHIPTCACPDLINLQALPDDLKTKLSIDDDLVSSPKEALSRASADRRMKYLNRYCLFLATVLYLFIWNRMILKNWIKKERKKESIMLLEAHMFSPKWFYLYIYIYIYQFSSWKKRKKTQNYFKFMEN
jgi:hypothetical protein